MTKREWKKTRQWQINKDNKKERKERKKEQAGWAFKCYQSLLNVIEMSTSMYVMHVYRHAQFECHSLNMAESLVLSIAYY